MKHSIHQSIYGTWTIYESPDAISAYRIGPELLNQHAAEEWLQRRGYTVSAIYHW